MTDLLTRIRAYVAAIPTHYCFQCSEDVVSVDGGRPNCGENWFPEKLTESPADALLREIAALEPVATVSHPGDLRAVSVQMRFRHGKELEVLEDIYTLTGDSHD